MPEEGEEGALSLVSTNSRHFSPKGLGEPLLREHHTW